eukprot:COSAG02_NODE_19_length_53976_cov_37.338512_10_plen_64_part_00
MLSPCGADPAGTASDDCPGDAASPGGKSLPVVSSVGRIQISNVGHGVGSENSRIPSSDQLNPA